MFVEQTFRQSDKACLQVPAKLVFSQWVSFIRILSGPYEASRILVHSCKTCMSTLHDWLLVQ